MAFTNADWLPSYEELTVPEINLTSAPLRAGAHHFGKYCDQQSKEYMLCNKELRDPRKCLNEGKEVTRCGVEFFNKVRDNCAAEFTDHWKCIDFSGFDMNFRKCRKTQAVFDQCVLDKLGQERPEVGYFSKVRVHKSVRPKAVPYSDIPLPEEAPEPPDPKTSPVPEMSKRAGRRNVFYQ